MLKVAVCKFISNVFLANGKHEMFIVKATALIKTLSMGIPFQNSRKIGLLMYSEDCNILLIAQ